VIEQKKDKERRGREEEGMQEVAERICLLFILFKRLNILQSYDIAQHYRIPHSRCLVVPNITSKFRTIAII
jgi:hypothetical protein